MTLSIWTDRSRIETMQHCARERYLRYHWGPDGLGLAPARKPLPLAVGGAVHAGLAMLLREGSMIAPDAPAWHWSNLEDRACVEALSDFRRETSTGVELEPLERQAMLAMPLPDMQALLEASLDGTVADIESLTNRTDEIRTRYEREFLVPEQEALVEAMVRAYARRRLRPLLEEFEVLEVEREGTWRLAQVAFAHDMEDIILMSRPDALLLHRRDRTLHIESFKTTASWDDRKRRDAERDMQGLSEGIEIEERLGRWWQDLHDGKWAGEHYDTIAQHYGSTRALMQFLASVPAPPRVHAIRMEYLLKGERWEDKDLSARYGFKARHQRTPLLRAYVARSTPQRGKSAGAYDIGDLCVSWDYHNEDGTTGKLAWQNWTSEPMYTQGRTVKSWIDQLDSVALAMSPGDSTSGIEPRELGYSSDVQKLGYLSTHPLDDVFIPPITIYRNEDDLRDLIEQIESQETRVAQGVAAIRAATDEGERRSLLNQHFAQTRRACEYPTTCPMTDICFGPDEMRLHPIESGKYVRRTPHHTPELEGRT